MFHLPRMDLYDGAIRMFGRVKNLYSLDRHTAYPSVAPASRVTSIVISEHFEVHGMGKPCAAGTCQREVAGR